MKLSLLTGTNSGGWPSLFQAARANSIKSNLCEGRRDNLGIGEKGGIIIFSTDVNATSQAGLLNWLSGRLQTHWSRLRVKQRVLDILDQKSIQCVSFGNYFKGYYKADDGRVFSEKSLAVEILFVDSETLTQLATEIAKKFNQQTVLVKDSNTNEMYFADQT